jgi:hypothetical protein
MLARLMNHVHKDNKHKYGNQKLLTKKTVEKNGIYLTFPISTHLPSCHNWRILMLTLSTRSSVEDPISLTKQRFPLMTFITAAVFQQRLSNTSTKSPTAQPSETSAGGGQGLITSLDTLSTSSSLLKPHKPSYLTQ